MRIDTIMRREVLTVRPATPLREVARLLVERGISGLPVVDEEGAVLGVVSEADFVLKESGAPKHRRGLERFFGGAPEANAKVEATTAGEAMTAPAITVGSVTSLQEAARIMVERAVNRLPVVDDGRLVGIVTRADVVRAFVRTDEELQRIVVDDVVLGAMWMDPAKVTVEVADGIVTIGGTLEKRSDGPILERLVRSVPGVIDVRMEAGWSLDDTELRAPKPDIVSPPGPPHR